MGPRPNMTDVLRKRGNADTDMHTKGMPRQRLGCGVSSRGTPKVASKPPEAMRGVESILP